MLNMVQGLGQDCGIEIEINDASQADINDLSLFPIDKVIGRFF